MQTTAPRTNRIPRISPRRPGLLRRLYTWLHRQALITRITDLENAKANLQHYMALDEAAALVHRIEYTKCPTLHQRMQGDRRELRKLDAAIAREQLALDELERQA